MDTKHWILYILFILFEVLFVSSIMEIYKKNVRKDHFNLWEIRALALVFSVGCVALLDCSELLYPLFSDMFGSDLWLDYLIYLIIFYFLQLKCDMLIVKKAMKSLALSYIRNMTGLDKESLEEILKKIEEEKKK